MLRRPHGRGQRCCPRQQEGRYRPGGLSAETSGEQLLGTLATELFRCHHADKSRERIFGHRQISCQARTPYVVDQGTVGELARREALARSLGRELGSLVIVKSNGEVHHNPSIDVGDVPGSGLWHSWQGPAYLPAG